MDFRTERVVDLAARVRGGEVSARELVGHALATIEAENPAVNAFVAVDGERALRAAAAVDELVAAGGDPGPLAGIPIGVKDLEDAAAYVTTKGSPAFADGPVATADSTLVARLVAAGCVVVGKTNTPEVGWKALTDNPVFGATTNPWNPEHTPGGSSGGSAAAIAAGMVPLATGSDGGGSIRIPSAACGLSGIKPSLGRVPSGGAHAPDWLSLSTKGPMARRFVDVAAALDVVVGPDPTDLRSLPATGERWSAAVGGPVVGVRVAWSPTLGYAPVDAEVLELCRRGVDLLAGIGAAVEEVDRVFDRDPVDDWLTLTGACNWRTFEAVRGSAAWEQTDPVLRMIVDGATNLTALDVVHAEDASHEHNLRLAGLFTRAQVLVTPTMAAVAPLRSLGGAGVINGVEEYNWVRMTYPFNLTRSPAATVCVGRSTSGVPVGLQVVGPQHGDALVLRVAGALEEAVGFDEVAPSRAG
jgi:aspartyl-tRNA(Asn)/glutamyl-tRNA(Gln) amidotransferase subunit A